MLKRLTIVFSVLLSSLACVLLAGVANADLVVSDGLTNPPWAVGDTVTNGVIYSNAVAGQPAPFNQFNGNINGTAAFDATWSFTYTVPPTITGATISLGLIYAPATGNTSPAKSFTLNGTIDLTSLLNAEMNAVKAPPFVDLYEVETVTIPSADLTAFGNSPVTFNLQLQGPGQGRFGTGPGMQAAIVNSTLDLQTSAAAAPEPASLVLLGGGLAALGLASRRRVFLER